MDPKKFTIRIESILGGHSPLSHFAQSDQYLASIGIDPSMPLDDVQGSYLVPGLLRPVVASNIGSTTVGTPLWIIGSPKSETNFYVYDSNGSAYTVNDSMSSLTALSDGGTLSSSGGNGCAYYDNYIYFAKNTDIARYGPLNGTPAFNGTYWTGTLSKAALVDTTYPVEASFATIEYPNHVLHRHSDGRLYIADVVGNQGTIHFIKTSKTSVEGDTDDGSTYSAVQVGYGLWPTAMESYGSDLVIAFMDLAVISGSRTIKGPRAKIAFWDTTSQNVNKITWVEFPDQIITGMKNVNGVLYITSAQQGATGFRLSRFVGGYTFEEIALFETGTSPFPGGLDGVGNRLYFGSRTVIPQNKACVYTYGLQKPNLKPGIFNVAAIHGIDNDSAYTRKNVMVTALNAGNYVRGTLLEGSPVLGIGGTSYSNAVASYGTDYSRANVYFWSQVYRIGQPFKITKIRIPLAQAMAANMTVVPKIHLDDQTDSTTLTTINNTNYPDKKNIVIRPENLTGQHNFWLELQWTGSVLCIVGLPITIEYELVDD